MLTELKLIKEFKNKFFHGEVRNTEGVKVDHIMWSFQYLDRSDRLQYYPTKPFRELKESDLVFHFEQKPATIGSLKRGSLASVGKFQNDITKWFVIDCDCQEATDEVRKKYLPFLESLGIEYIWEFSGNAKEEKAHVWIMCDSLEISLLKRLGLFLLKEAGIDYRDKDLGFELFPILKPTNVIRLPGGYHLKTKQVNGILYKGVVDSSPEFIMSSFINATPVTKELAEELLKNEKVEEKRVFAPRKNSKFYYNSLNLKLPDEHFPPVIRKVASNCQALNRVITECASGSLLEDKKGFGHTAGLWLWRLAMFNDARANRNSRIKNEEGNEWIKEFTEKHRLNPYDSHNWDRDREAVLSEPERYFPRCETWEANFNYCEGCPLKKRANFTSPRQIWQGFPITKRMVKPVNLVFADEIRQTTFKTVKSKISYYLENNKRKDILLASPQSSGKSYAVDEIAVDLAERGYSVLIAVPTADLAMQHKTWCEERGQKAFAVMSHEKQFEHLNLPFDCPHEGEIKRMYDLGMSSGMWKKAFCNSCPFKEQCPYPEQYKNINEGDKKIVIIQHAHFSCRETLMHILKKRFDVLFIDEAFIDSIYKEIKPTSMELEIMDSFRLETPWSGVLCDWIGVGGYPKKDGDRTIIKPTETQLENLKYKMEEHNCKWNIPDYIRYYNLNMYLENHCGFQVFYPIPEMPVRVLTDATPPLELLKIVLNNNEIEVFGDDEVLDYRRLNKDNKVIQLLDSSVSKSSLKGPPDENGDYSYDRFILFLEFILDKIKTECKDKKVLITTYADELNDQFTSVAINWLKRNYPEGDIGKEPPSQICVNHMQIGTNKFSEYTYQFLLAGVYRNAKQFEYETYKIKTIANYWNRLDGRPEIPNPFPFGVGDNASIERVEEAVKKITTTTGNKAAIFEYDNFIYRRPKNYYHNITEKFSIAKTQQAIRLRFKTEEQHVVYVLGNFYLPSFLVTDVMVEDEMLGTLS